MNKNRKISLLLLGIACTLVLQTLPHHSEAQTTPQNTGNTHTVSVPPSESLGTANTHAYYQFIAPIEPLIEGITIASPDGTKQYSDVSRDDALQQYLRAWFKFLIGIAGIIGVIRLVFSGFSIILGSSKPGVYSKAKDELTSIILSLLIIAASWIFLNTINPRLVDTNLLIEVATTTPAELTIAPEPSAPGWYFKYQFKKSGYIRYSGPYKTNEGENNENLKIMYLTQRTIMDSVGDSLAMMTMGASKLAEGPIKDMLISGTVGCPYEREFYVKNRPSLNPLKLLREDVEVLTPCEWFPKGKPALNPDGTPVSEYGSPGFNYSKAEDDNRALFNNSGILINKNACPTPNATDCTTVGNLDAQSLLTHFKKLAQTGGFENLCQLESKNCPIVITGGGEAGHKTHGGPYTLDIRKNTEYVEKTLLNNALAIAPGLNAGSPRYYFDGYWYNDERASGVTPHFHICKTQPPIRQGELSNTRLCGTVWAPDKVKDRRELECVRNPQNENQWLCRSKDYKTVCPLPVCKTPEIWENSGTNKNAPPIETKLLKDIIQ